MTELEFLYFQVMSYMHCKKYCNGAMHINAQIAENIATIILVYMEIPTGVSRGGGYVDFVWNKCSKVSFSNI